MSLILPSSESGGLADIAAQARRLADALDRLAANRGRPSAADLAGAPVLDCWQPTTRWAPALIGLATGHPRIGAGRATVTSELFAVDTTASWARTWSRYYRLGDAAPAIGGRFQ